MAVTINVPKGINVPREVQEAVMEPDDRVVLSRTEARAGRIVTGGAIRRILFVSLGLVIAGMLVVYLYFF